MRSYTLKFFCSVFLQCNKKAKRTDIVLLYAHKLRAVDNTEQENLKRYSHLELKAITLFDFFSFNKLSRGVCMCRSLEQEQSLRRKAELESAQCRLQLQVVTDECGKLRREVQV